MEVSTAQVKTYEEELLELVRKLDATGKQDILNYARRVVQLPPTVSGKEFLERTKHLIISDEDAAEMMAAIEESFNVIEEIEIDLDA